MRILIYSRAFLPQVGGLELNVAHRAEQFVLRGHEVVVITTTPGNGGNGLPYRVLRNPGARAFMRWMRWCEVFHHPNVSLRGIWPLLLIRRPWVVSHHSWYRSPDGRIAWQDRLKRFVLRFAAGSIAVSRAVADDLATPSVVIGNAYRDQLFRILPDTDRALDLIFVGRLVSDKGADILLEALRILAQAGRLPGLTVVGEGPERPALEAQARRLALADRVRFLGTKTGEGLVRILNRHRILVAPSRYNEPFGIVALEGIACGCVVVGSGGGGLKDAIGDCGRVFPNGDPAALAQVLGALLRDPAAMAECVRSAPAHLSAHTAEHVMGRYLEVFESAARRGRQR
jgi:glycosyltransferase involved in cell wall biosynthesis